MTGIAMQLKNILKYIQKVLASNNIKYLIINVSSKNNANHFASVSNCKFQLFHAIIGNADNREFRYLHLIM